ncbi:hypothetical protein BYT27DRAFT_7202920, partial [Phlegmacium glaucopus]
MAQQHQLEAPKPINYHEFQISCTEIDEEAAESCKTLNNPSQHPTPPSLPPNPKTLSPTHNIPPVRSNHSGSDRAHKTFY